MAPTQEQVSKNSNQGSERLTRRSGDSQHYNLSDNSLGSRGPEVEALDIDELLGQLEDCNLSLGRAQNFAHTLIDTIGRDFLLWKSNSISTWRAAALGGAYLVPPSQNTRSSLHLMLDREVEVKRAPCSKFQDRRGGR